MGYGGNGREKPNGGKSIKKRYGNEQFCRKSDDEVGDLEKIFWS
jgi:hypothetical protein